MKMLATILLICLSLAAQVCGQVTVESMVDSNTILIGDVITYSVIVKHDPDVELDLLELAENLGQFELRNYDKKEPEKQDGQIVERIDYEISTFESGEFEIPPLQIGYQLPGDSTRYRIKSEPILISVESLNPDDSGDIRGIKPVKTPSYNYARLYRNIAIGMFGALLVAALVWVILRRRRGESILPGRNAPPRPAHDIALERLTALQQSTLIENEQIKDYYTELSEALREYIANRYFIHALEMTTLELLQHMKRETIQSETIEQLHDLLSVCDLVKFAGFIPDAGEHERLLQSGFEFVNNTKISLAVPDMPEADTEEAETEDASAASGEVKDA
ncbi:MAG: hypothetical protein U5R06_24045 [candidate division KSB1 bacterium]|nr:hypothetical protein [candidate division KSB1 bacterium]